MPARNPDLHGSAPESCPVALLLIDVINAMDFDTGPALMEAAIPMAHRIAALKRRAKALGIPAIYANDNFGRWQSDFRKVVEHCLQDGVTGAPLARILEPEEDDYFVLKPKHSAFYATTLDTLLAYIGARSLIMTGIAGNICILFTANDAYMRDFELYVPEDCTISNSPRENEHALQQIRKVLKADTTPSDRLDLEAILKKSRKEQCG
ncbi:MAG TPA: isochorismatase family cysteine hydrolase [Candidatus Limnocylindrales bacterium]|nr:isochorismatase family cysteine hydrolase [Candidatus Limnocylindrales bacterium]